MKVSILVPIYGVEKFIEHCAISLFEQTYENIEYIFVNDCTKDNSIIVLKEVIDKYPHRKESVKIIEHETNKGLAGARNTGVQAATGDFIMHVDSDDYVDRSIVEKSVEKQKKTDADIVVIDFIKRYPSFSKITQYVECRNTEDYCKVVLSRKNSNSIWAKLIRRSLYIENEIKCIEGLNQGEDYQIVPVLLYFAKRIVNLREPLYIYDCSNEGAYSNSFTVSKHNQNWGSMNIVRDFFKLKGTDYVEAVEIGRLRQIADDFIISCKAKGDVASTYYSYARNELHNVDKKLICNVQIPKRFIIWFSGNYFVMKFYVLSMRNMNHFRMYVKSKLFNR